MLIQFEYRDMRRESKCFNWYILFGLSLFAIEGILLIIILLNFKGLGFIGKPLNRFIEFLIKTCWEGKTV